MGFAKKALKAVVDPMLKVATLGQYDSDDLVNVARDVTGANAREEGRQAKYSADELAARQLHLAEDQFAFEKDLLLKDRTKADEDYSRRLGIIREMREGADFSPDFYAQQIGSATAGVRTAMNKAREEELRTLSRYGVNPNSGRFADIVSRFGTQGAAAEAAAANATRHALGAEERGRKDNALIYDLQVTPTYPGRNVDNPAISVLGNQADNYYAMYGAHTAQGNESRAGLVNMIGKGVGNYLGVGG